MGLIRSGVIITLSTLLFLTLFLGNSFLTLDWSLEHQNVLEHSQNFSEILSTQNITVDEIYYQNYDCSLFECIKEDGSPLVLISETSKEYFHQKFLYVTLISLALIVILFLFLESKSSIFTITGILMIFAALPYKKLNWALSFLPEGKITELFQIFFTKSVNVFTIMLIIGGILLALGIGFEFLGLGLKINTFLDKFRRNKQIESLQEKIDEKEKNLEDSISKEEVKKIVKSEIKKQKNKDEIQKNINKIVKQELKTTKKK